MSTTIPTTMKSVWMMKRGDPLDDTVLTVKDDIAVPTPKKGQVLVKVAASAMNPVDWKCVDGSFPILSKNSPLGVDVAGTIAAIPEGTPTTTLQVGDKVFGPLGELTPGSHAQYCVMKAEQLCAVPKNMSMRQAAALPVAALSAWQGLVKWCNVKEGDKIFIGGGSGGVGSMAVQVAKHLGAKEIWVTGSKVEFIKNLGATKVINYKEENVIEALKGQEFDSMFDTVGSIDPWLAAMQGAIKKGGKYVTVIGDGDGSLVNLFSRWFWRAFKGFVGLGPSYSFFSIKAGPPEAMEDLLKVKELVESEAIKPILVDQEFFLTPESFREMLKISMSGRTTGKLVMTVNH